jgi:hypothetical protein
VLKTFFNLILMFTAIWLLLPIKVKLCCNPLALINRSLKFGWFFLDNSAKGQHFFETKILTLSMLHFIITSLPGMASFLSSYLQKLNKAFAGQMYKLSYKLHQQHFICKLKKNLNDHIFILKLQVHPLGKVA